MKNVSLPQDPYNVIITGVGGQGMSWPPELSATFCPVRE